MQLNVEQKKLLQWIEAKQPVIGLFHVMTDLRPMIDKGLIASQPVVGAQGRLVITHVGKTALTALNSPSANIDHNEHRSGAECH